MSKKKAVSSDIKVDLPKTAEAPKERSMVEIQQEYQGLCVRAGNLQYQVFTHQKDLNLLNDQIRNLNFEAAAIQAKLAAAQVKPAEQKEAH